MFGSALLYYLVLKPISLLPYFILYRVSDFFFFMLYYVIPYRKKVVMGNLKRCFPEKSDQELKAICRKFYRHFCDLVVESIKNFSISKEEAQKRFVTTNPEVMNAFAEKGQAIILTGGHYTNWELWAMAGPLAIDIKVVAIYKKLSNDYFDKKMRESRGKFGLHMVRTLDTGEYFHRHAHEVNAMVFAIDQSPSNPKKCVWIDFMGQETGALYGAEKYAKDFSRPVIFGRMKRIKRGHYEISYEVVTEDPRSFAHGEIIQKTHRLLEEDIRKAPEYWLWTHKRWKHKRPN